MRKPGELQVKQVCSQLINPRDNSLTKLDFHVDVDVEVYVDVVDGANDDANGDADVAVDVEVDAYVLDPT